MNRQKPSAPQPPKQPYRTPVLKVHGNLRTLTAAKGGTSQDGAGKPRTRINGRPA